MLKEIKVEEMSRKTKANYIKSNMFIYLELASNEELNELFTTTEAAVSSWFKGKRP